MDTTPIVLDRGQARELWRSYMKHRHWSKPIDADVAAAYQKIAQGKVIIKALESIVKAGLNEQGLPKLAIARADQSWCWFQGNENGAAIFTTKEAALWSWRDRAYVNHRVEFTPGSFPITTRVRGRAVVPQVPLPLRPQRALQAYHVLWEAEWRALPPVDPLLLRRIGITDMWVVCAAWDLTEVERMALSARMNS